MEGSRIRKVGLIAYIMRALHNPDDTGFGDFWVEPHSFLYFQRESMPGWITSAPRLRNCVRVPWHCQDQQRSAVTKIMVRLMDTSCYSWMLDDITLHALVQTRWLPISHLWKGIEIRTLIIQGLWYGYDPPLLYLSPYPLSLTLSLYWNSFSSQSWFSLWMERSTTYELLGPKIFLPIS